MCSDSQCDGLLVWGDDGSDFTHEPAWMPPVSADEAGASCLYYNKTANSIYGRMNCDQTLSHPGEDVPEHGYLCVRDP